MIRNMKKKEEDVGELFLTQLNKEDLKKLGFDSSAIERIKYVDVYLVWHNDEFAIKFVWHGIETQAYILNVNKMPKWIYHYIIDKYIET